MKMVKLILAATFMTAPIALVSTHASARDNLLTCNIPSQDICGEYNFSRQKDQQNFAKQCLSGGAVVTEDEHVCSSKVGYCLHKSGGREVKTYAYGRDQSTVSRNCEANGGTYKN